MKEKRRPTFVELPLTSEQPLAMWNMQSSLHASHFGPVKHLIYDL